MKVVLHDWIVAFESPRRIEDGKTQSQLGRTE